VLLASLAYAQTAPSPSGTELPVKQMLGGRAIGPLVLQEKSANKFLEEIDLEDINEKIKFCFYYSTTISDIYVVCNSNYSW
jgi:hypothetical protein